MTTFAVGFGTQAVVAAALPRPLFPNEEDVESIMKGELISLAVAVSWTATAMFAEVASRRLTPLGLNVVRMALSLAMLAGVMLWATGSALPADADGETWLWLSLSGFVGYVLGDYCLFNSYMLIGSRFGQLFMTLAPAAAALSGLLLLGETMSPLAIVGMLVTMSGIGISVLSKGRRHHVALKLPLKGVLFGIGAGVGQGIGLVLSKMGMTHYETLIQSPDALAIMPFSSTFMRAVTGFAGFGLAMLLTGRTRRVARGVADRRGMLAALAATVTGPFIGVSLSLMAVLHTSTGIAQTIMAMTPVFILLPSRHFFRQRVTPPEIAGALIAVAGVAMFFI